MADEKKRPEEEEQSEGQFQVGTQSGNDEGKPGFSEKIKAARIETKAGLAAAVAIVLFGVLFGTHVLCLHQWSEATCHVAYVGPRRARPSDMKWSRRPARARSIVAAAIIKRAKRSVTNGSMQLARRQRPARAAKRPKVRHLVTKLAIGRSQKRRLVPRRVLAKPRVSVVARSLPRRSIRLLISQVTGR